MSKKSHRLRTTSAPPPRRRPPRCIGIVGVASEVVHVLPPSKVCATYRCHTPVKVVSLESPVVGAAYGVHNVAFPTTTAGDAGRGRREGDVVNTVCSTDVVHVFPRLFFFHDAPPT